MSAKAQSPTLCVPQRMGHPRCSKLLGGEYNQWYHQRVISQREKHGKRLRHPPASSKFRRQLMTVQFKGRRSGFQFLALAVACLAVLLAQAARPSDTVSENQILARAKSLFGRPTPADSHIFLIGEGFGA